MHGLVICLHNFCTFYKFYKKNKVPISYQVCFLRISLYNLLILFYYFNFRSFLIPERLILCYRWLR